MPDPLSVELAVMFIRQPAMAVRLMTEHVDDGFGYCAMCSSHSRRPRWPCSVAWHTHRANDITQSHLTGAIPLTFRTRHPA